MSYDQPRGCAAAYYPETNPLVPLDSTAEGSNTPDLEVGRSSGSSRRGTAARTAEPGDAGQSGRRSERTDVSRTT